MHEIAPLFPDDRLEQPAAAAYYTKPFTMPQVPNPEVTLPMAREVTSYTTIPLSIPPLESVEQATFNWERYTQPPTITDPEAWDLVCEVSEVPEAQKWQKGFRWYIQTSPIVQLARELIASDDNEDDRASELTTVVELLARWAELTSDGDPQLYHVQDLRAHLVVSRAAIYKQWKAEHPLYADWPPGLAGSIDDCGEALKPWLAQLSELDFLMLKRLWTSTTKRPDRWKRSPLCSDLTSLIGGDDIPLEGDDDYRPIKKFAIGSYHDLVRLPYYKVQVLHDSEAWKKRLERAAGDETAAIHALKRGRGSAGISNPKFQAAGEATRQLGSKVHRAVFQVWTGMVALTNTDPQVRPSFEQMLTHNGSTTVEDWHQVVKLCQQFFGFGDEIYGSHQKEAMQALQMIAHELLKPSLGPPAIIIPEMRIGNGSRVDGVVLSPGLRCIDGMQDYVTVGTTEPLPTFREFKGLLNLIDVAGKLAIGGIEFVEVKARFSKIKPEGRAFTSLAGAWQYLRDANLLGTISPTFSLIELTPSHSIVRRYTTSKFANLMTRYRLAV